MTDGPVISVLFVCTGNICRSPLAEGVFLHQAVQRGASHRFEVDSAGVGSWHIGDRADPRALAVAADHGIDLPSVARQIDPADFTRFDHIVCADEENREALLEWGAPAEKTSLLLAFDSTATLREVPDPYLGGRDGFAAVYGLVDSACAALLDRLLQSG